MDTRDGAFESPMSHHSQEVLFIFITSQENFFRRIEVERIFKETWNFDLMLQDNADSARCVSYVPAA